MPAPDPSDLRVEVTLTCAAAAVYFILLPIEVDPPNALNEALALFRSSDRARAVMVGGDGATLIARLKDVATGCYTLCVVVSDKPHPDVAAATSELEARYEVEVAEKSAQTFMDFLARVKREPGFRTFPADFSASVVRTYPIEVTDAPSSRVASVEA